MARVYKKWTTFDFRKDNDNNCSLKMSEIFFFNLHLHLSVSQDEFQKYSF